MNRRRFLQAAAAAIAFVAMPAPRGPATDPAPLPYSPKPMVRKLVYWIPVTDELLADVRADNARTLARYGIHLG